MRRPEGFDRPTRDAAPPRSRGRAATLAPPAPVPTRMPAQAPAPTSPVRAPEPAEREPAAVRVRSAKAELRTAGRARKRAEKAEIRRFTRRTHRWRVAIASTASLVLLLGLMLVAAVFSPVLALRHISIQGTSRLDAGQLHRAVDGQLGTPLALLDEKRIRAELGVFPLIRSYSTEIVPPDRVIIHVVERQPIGALEDGTASDGVSFELVDPAGVTVASSQARPAGVPLIQLPPSQGVDGAGFPAMTRVLLSLPPDLLARVDTVTARTVDDVSFTLSGSGQTVKWGSANDAAAKVQTLGRMPQWVAGQKGTFDVTAPGTAIFTAG